MTESEEPSPGRVVAVSRSGEHRFSKPSCAAIRLIAGIGVEGDAHAGTTVKHRSRVAADPSQPNLRQVHLVAQELLDDLNERGFELEPGSIGENLTTRGIDLLALPRDTLLAIGADVILCLTGRRNPCKQLDQHRPGLMAAVLDEAREGAERLRAGVMAVVVEGGEIRPGDLIRPSLPAEPWQGLERV